MSASATVDVCYEIGESKTVQTDGLTDSVLRLFLHSTPLAVRKSIHLRLKTASARLSTPSSAQLGAYADFDAR